MLARVWGTSIIVVTLLAGACGDDGRTTPDASAPQPDAQLRKRGLIAIIEDAIGNNTMVLANFGTDVSTPVSSRDDGPCHIDLRYGANTLPVNAGTLTVTDPSGGMLSIPFNGPNGGYFAMTSGLTYAAGAQLTITSTGAMVPAFSQTRPFPAPLTLTSGSPTVLHKSGFSASWNPPMTSPVVIAITQYPSGAPQLSIRCTFDATTSTGMVPASALTDILTTEAAGVGIATEHTATFAAGEYETDVFTDYERFNGSVPVQP